MAHFLEETQANYQLPKDDSVKENHIFCMMNLYIKHLYILNNKK